MVELQQKDKGKAIASLALDILDIKGMKSVNCGLVSIIGLYHC